MQHVSTLIMLVLPMDYFVLEVPTFVQDVPFVCFMHARSVQRIGNMDFEPFLSWAGPTFLAWPANQDAREFSAGLPWFSCRQLGRHAGRHDYIMQEVPMFYAGWSGWSGCAG